MNIIRLPLSAASQNNEKVISVSRDAPQKEVFWGNFSLPSKSINANCRLLVVLESG